MVDYGTAGSVVANTDYCEIVPGCLYSRGHLGPHCTTYSLGPNGAYVVLDETGCGSIAVDCFAAFVPQADLDTALARADAAEREQGAAVAALATARADASLRVCFIVAVGCDVQLNIVRAETLGWWATLDAARAHVLRLDCDWTEAGYYSHLMLFDPGTREVAWYRSVLPEGWVFGYGCPPVPLAPCDAPEWWDAGNPGETYLVNVLGEIETRSRLRAGIERAEADNAALVAGRDQAIARVAYLERHGAEVREELTVALAEAHEGRAREIARCDALDAVVRALPKCPLGQCGKTATRGGDGWYYCDAHGADHCDLPYAVALRALDVTRG